MRATWNLKSYYLLKRSGYSRGDRGLILYATDKLMERGLGIHGSTKQGYEVQGGWGSGATSPDQSGLSNNAS